MHHRIVFLVLVSFLWSCQGTEVAQLATGDRHTCALSDDGDVRCWGDGSSGQLGYGNTENIGDDESPASAGNVNVGGTVVQVTSGEAHTCALLDTGHVRCWGNGSLGQLGHGNTENIGDDESPASAGDVDVGGTVTQISAGGSHTCALLKTGRVRCWGNGSSGQLGYGDTKRIGDDEAPSSAGEVDVEGLVIQISAGRSHTCALLGTGAVRCWGSYGNGNSADVEIGGSAIQVSAGSDYTCALLDTGSVRCYGQISIGEPSAAGDVDVGGKVTQISAGNVHVCALLDTGHVRCWGSNADGRLGYKNNKTVGDNENPASAGDVDVGGTVIRISAGGSHTCALLDTGRVRCWGSGSSGQLGYPHGADELPSSVGDTDVGGTLTQISTGVEHACAVQDTGSVRCWGSGSLGRLGYGNTETIGDDESPSFAGTVDVGGAVTQTSAGGTHTCALLDTGSVRCWGSNEDGQLGYLLGFYDFLGDNESPSSAGDVDVGGRVIQISAGEVHTCALLDTGHVRCWGSNEDGRLGYLAKDVFASPAELGDVDIGGTVTQISAGRYHTCALLDTGSVRCWGRAAFGQLGYGNRGDVWVPPSYAGDVDVGGTATQISAGFDHTCALLDTGNVRCWGSGQSGQLGYGNMKTVGDDETPSSVGDVDVGGTVIQISAGFDHTCALLDTGSVRCWGSGSNLALGYGNATAIGDDETPSSAGDVDVGETVAQVSAGNEQTCVVLESGNLRCWGTGAAKSYRSPSAASDVHVF